MTKNEFEQIAGYEVSNDDYHKVIEPMYMATNLDKIEFVATLNKARFALPSKKKMISDMRKIAKHLEETCTHYYDGEAEQKLNDIADAYADRFHHGSKKYINTICKQSCYYPSSIEFFFLNGCGPVEVIKL